MAIAGLYDCFNHWAEVGTVWVISDTHFGDEDVKKMVPNRPSDDELVKIINSKVGKKDTLLLLGDVGDIEYAKRLKGYKVLIAGNHDAGLTNYQEVFNEVYGGALFIGEKLVLSHEPIDVPFALNLHGHIHSRTHKNDIRHFNVCCDVLNGYLPINFNQFMKVGPTAHIQSVHRDTINKATKRKQKHGGKKVYEK